MDKEMEADEFGPVRDRRDFDPLNLCLKPILPCPPRELSFTGRTGWRYCPFVPFSDRLGLSRRFQDCPSTTMTIPESWQGKGAPSHNSMDLASHDDSHPDDAPRKRFQKSCIPKKMNLRKRQRVDNATCTTTETSEFCSNSLLDSAQQSIAPSIIGASTAATLVSESTSSTYSNGTSGITTLSAATDVSMSRVATPKRKKDAETENSKGATVVSASTPATNLARKFSKATISRSDTVPKAAMSALYGRKPRKKQISNKNYLTWNNGAKSHELKFTAIFLCPITNEAFLAGKYGDTYEQHSCLVWYKRKTLAEHAAAARAYDCFMLREQFVTDGQLGIDPPYSAKDRPILPLNQIPPNIVQAIQEAQRAENRRQENMAVDQQEQPRLTCLPTVPMVERPHYPTTSDRREQHRRNNGQTGNPFQDFATRPPPHSPEVGRSNGERGHWAHGRHV